MGCGLIYELVPPAAPATQWTETVLHRFTGGADGGVPFGNVVLGLDGAIYGTTLVGGAANAGAVYQLR